MLIGFIFLVGFFNNGIFVEGQEEERNTADVATPEDIEVFNLKKKNLHILKYFK